MATVAGALMLPGGSAFAACAPLTAGPDATLCTGNLDNSNSDALAGNDTITFTAGTNVGNDAGATVSGGLDNDSIVLSNSAIGKGARSEGLVLGDVGADTITINNSYVGGSGAGTVGGGDGNDSISLSNGRIGQNLQSTGQVMGDAGADTIMLDKTYLGDSGDGTVSGGLDSDFIALSNSIIGRNGRSTGQVLGDAGADTITLNQSVVGFQGAGTVSGGDGNDSIALSNKSAIGFLAGSTGQVLGDAGNDTVTINNSVVGGAGAATVDGGADNDSIALTNGASIGPRGKVLGSAGNDTVSIDDSITRSGGSVIDGGADTDLLSFTAKGNATVTPRAFLNFERLQKLGAGTLTLSGSQTWSESTTVSAGTLNVAGVLTSGTTRVEPGATLATSGGSFVGSVVNQGTVSPGGAGRVETTSVTGALAQTGTGILAASSNLPSATSGGSSSTRSCRLLAAR
jgi:fibronectin-binding autotransporter adhesin